MIASSERDTWASSPNMAVISWLKLVLFNTPVSGSVLMICSSWVTRWVAVSNWVCCCSRRLWSAELISGIRESWSCSFSWISWTIASLICSTCRRCSQYIPMMATRIVNRASASWSNREGSKMACRRWYWAFWPGCERTTSPCRSGYRASSQRLSSLWLCITFSLESCETTVMADNSRELRNAVNFCRDISGVANATLSVAATLWLLLSRCCCWIR